MKNFLMNVYDYVMLLQGEIGVTPLESVLHNLFSTKDREELMYYTSYIIDSGESCNDILDVLTDVKEATQGSLPKVLSYALDAL